MKIKDARVKKALLRALADEQTARILQATALRPRSVMDLTREEGLPSSSTYRHVHQLETDRLLVVARTVVTPDGKSYQMYRATFRQVDVKFTAGEVLMTAEPNLSAVQKAFRLFHSFVEEI